MKDISFLFGLVLVVLAFIGLCTRVIMKVMQGDGLEHYFAGFGYQFNYLGTLIVLGLIPLALVVALFIRRHQMRDEKNFKDNYLD